MGRHQAKGQRHRTWLEDRGHTHLHRWLPRCTCGWEGVPMNLKARARQEREAHLSSTGRVRGRTRRVAQARECTPVDQLPEALR